MRTVVLGRTGLGVSRVGFGGIPIQRLTEAEAVRVVQRCLDLGITFFDTANGYTTSEERIGKAIQGRRDGVVLATKTGARDKEMAEEHLALSLRRLQVDHIDLWQFHNVSDRDAYERVLGPGGALEAARDAVEAGKVGHVGLTSHSMEVALAAVESTLFETIQFPFNFVTNEAEARLVPLARAHDVGFIAMKPFGGGLLDDARLAIKYLLQFEGVVPDPGVQSVDEIEEIAGIVAGAWALTDEERREIERIRGIVDRRFCRRCQYCEPCPQGVRISVVMTVRSFVERFPPEMVATGFVAQAMASASACIECGECEDKCPYRLPIREMIRENVAYYEQALASATR
ncbi:MAG: aldo/keto reductase [Anaerolineae bacterium]|nr:aldo/keto reductase [Anaerolineae bacterium]